MVVHVLAVKAENFLETEDLEYTIQAKVFVDLAIDQVLKFQDLLSVG